MIWKEEEAKSVCLIHLRLPNYPGLSYWEKKASNISVKSWSSKRYCVEALLSHPAHLDAFNSNYALFIWQTVSTIIFIV